MYNPLMDHNQLREAYLNYFKDRGHKEIPPAGLIPENDSTTLFTGSGMQPLLPYLLGQEHPMGTRLVDSQPCFRAEDIDEVGDNRHTTFFEMLGNWSLGDYFKREQLGWFFGFLTDMVKLDPEKLYVTVFAGEENAGLPRDEEAVGIWKKLFADKGIEAKAVELGTEENAGKVGMQGGRIFYYGAKKNWWSRAGVPENMPIGEPGGGDSEVFYEFSEVDHNEKFGKHCHPNCDCGRFVEIGNSVFMEYVKRENGFEKLPKKNVDFGGGFERILAAMNNDPDVFVTSIFAPIIEEIEKITATKYDDYKTEMRIIADHIRIAVVLIAQGLEPANKLQGYFLRRLIRRSVLKMRNLMGEKIQSTMLSAAAGKVMEIYATTYTKDVNKQKLIEVLEKEVAKFAQTLEQGLKKIEGMEIENIDEVVAFDLLQTFGFPFELTEEIVTARGGKLDKGKFEEERRKHQDASRTASAGMFKGGLGSTGDVELRYHTGTHLLQAALRRVLGDHVRQKGSNITPERLRFDFAHGEKLSESEIVMIDKLIAEWVGRDLEVKFETMPYEEAVKLGALSVPGEKYPEMVKVYSIGDSKEIISREMCGGPHVERLGTIGELKIYKQESVSSGVRRIYMRIG